MNWTDKSSVLLAIEQDPNNIKYVNEEFRDDKDVVISASMRIPELFQFASDRLKRDIGVIRILYKTSPDILDYVPLEIQEKFLPLLKGMSISSKNLISVIKYKSMNVIVDTDTLLYKQVNVFKKALDFAYDHISKSKVPSFHKVLYGTEIILTTKNRFLEKYDVGGPTIPGETVAFYWGYKIYFFTDSIFTVEMPGVTLIHELSHMFQLLYMTPKGNEEIDDLYEQAISQEPCKLTLLPKIGDPLSNIMEDGKWAWDVKYASDSEEYYLTRIENKMYFYTNKKGDQKFFPESFILRMVRCPSKYGATGYPDFFAEMCTAITINRMKPHLRLMVGAFLNIVKKNLK